MNVSFQLVNKNKKGERLIILVACFNNEKFVYSTGRNILPEYWDKTNMRPLLDKEHPKQILAVNKITKNILDRHETIFMDITGEYNRSGIAFTREIIKADMLNALKPSAVKKQPKSKNAAVNDFYILLQRFIDDSEAGIRLTKKGTIIKNSRILKYKVLKKNLLEFRPEIKVADIDMDFYQQLITWRNEKNKAINTIGTDIKIIKSVLRYTFSKGLHQNNIFLNEEFRSFEEIPEHVYLNDADLNKLWNLKKLSAKHEKVRDIFIIGCYTSLRISDLGVLEAYNIINSRSGSMLKIIQHKGNEPVFIPIHSRVRQLLHKYGGVFPKAYSEQKMNEYIREVCVIAKLNEKQQFKITRGGVVHRYVKEKHEMVTNHTARRTFATNMVIAGFNPLHIMKITGHKTLKDFMRYVCVTQQETAMLMSKHKYFK